MAAGRVRHADMWPCSAQRSAQLEQQPRGTEEERPGECGERSSGPRQRLVQQHDDEKQAELQFGGEWLQQMRTTSFNAEGHRLSTRRSCPSAEERRRGARLSVEEIAEDNGGNQLGGDAVRIWGMQRRNRLQRVCCYAHRLLILPVEQLEWRWLENESNRTLRTMSCAHC